METCVNEINLRFSQRDSNLYASVSALHLKITTFWVLKMVKILLDLAKCTTAEAKFVVAKTYIAKSKSDDKPKTTTTSLLFEHSELLD